MAMAIYIDDGDTVKTYPVKAKVAKAVMTLLESDDELVWSRTHPGYGVVIVDEKEREEWLKDYKRLLEQESVLDKIGTEIEGLTYHWCDDNSRDLIDEVLNILDRYKTRNEE